MLRGGDQRREGHRSQRLLPSLRASIRRSTARQGNARDRRGICGKPVTSSHPTVRVHRWISIGLVTSRAQPAHQGLWLVLTPGDQAGQVQVEDGQIELSGVRAAVRGTAIVANGLRRGTFTVFGRGPLGPTASTPVARTVSFTPSSTLDRSSPGRSAATPARSSSGTASSSATCCQPELEIVTLPIGKFVERASSERLPLPIAHTRTREG